MTDDLSDEEAQMQMARRAGGMDEEDEDLEADVNPRRGGAGGQRRQKKQAQARATYDDGEDF